jgi:tryptophanyl-tRNA synthetase
MRKENEKKAKDRVLAGMRATGRLHLGNYLGGAKGMLALQDSDDYETLYMVADMHGITTPYEVEDLKQNRREMVIDYLAVGLDPKKSVIFEQSEIELHGELAFYLSSVVTIARMRHLPTFKEKVKQYPQGTTMALLNYPILMASDILIYKASLVPVGVDQEPHLEVAREVARKMNNTYGTDFPEPERFTIEGNEYVPSLLGEGKMSKSVEGSYINLSDDPETIKSKLAAAPTDSGKGSQVPKEGGVANLLKFVELFEGEGRRRHYEELYKGEGIKYSELKDKLANAIYEELVPIQERRRVYENDPSLVDRILDEGAKKARVIADQTVEEVKEKMGLV